MVSLPDLVEEMAHHRPRVHEKVSWKSALADFSLAGEEPHQSLSETHFSGTTEESPSDTIGYSIITGNTVLLLQSVLLKSGCLWPDFIKENLHQFRLGVRSRESDVMKPKNTKKLRYCQGSGIEVWVEIFAQADNLGCSQGPRHRGAC